MDKEGARKNMGKTIMVDGKELPIWKIFLYGTIGFFSFDALLGIFLILCGSAIDDYTFVGKLASTTSILGLFCLLTMNNVLRRESKDKVARVSATAAIVMNVVWIIPWLLIVWSCFDGLKAKCVYPEYPSYRSYGTVEYENAMTEYEQKEDEYQKCLEPYRDAQEISWKIIGDGIVAAVFLTLLANYLSIKSRATAIVAMKIVALVCGAILALFLMAQISSGWFSVDEMTSKLIAIIGIVFAFSVVTTPILVRGEKKKSGKNEMVDDGGDTNVVAQAMESPKPAIDRAELRREIELELRAQIEAELREKIEKEMRAEIEAEYTAKKDGE